jgi:tetratricopeptide (TPR) repeat protein
VTGNAVNVPDPARPTVLVLLNSRQLSDQGLMRAISTAVPEEKRAQVILVECGAESGSAAPASPWPIVPDPDRQISAELDVHGWPTALVLQSDGLEVARIGGASESLALKLGPYLELAAQTLDRAAVERKLTKNTIVGEGATRDLLEAQRLISDRKPAQALKLLDAAIGRDPSSIELRLATARALIELGRHTEAKTVLKVVLDHRQELPDAHYLMGQIYERAGDWEAAAKEYRAAGGR